MARFVLLHGFCGQPEQWAYLRDELEGRGHSAVALRLPRGSWTDEVEAVRAEGAGAVLVGHSLGGILVRAFAEAHPDVAGGLATIAAPAPDSPRPNWIREVGSYDDTGVYRPDVEAFLRVAFPDAPHELADLTWAQPPLRGEVPLTGGRGHEPRLAIVCVRDRAIDPGEQRRAADAFGAAAVEMDAGHSPHVSHPTLVASLLIDRFAPDRRVTS